MRRFMVIAIFVVGMIIALAAVMVNVVQHGGRADLEAERAKWEALGGVPDPNALPRYEVAPVENAAFVYLDVFEEIAPLLRQYRAVDGPRNFVPEICDDETLVAIVERSWQAAQRTGIDWISAYETVERPALQLNLSAGRDHARVLSAAAECFIERGETDRAARAIAAGLVLGERPPTEMPGIITILVGAAIHTMMLHNMQEIFRDRELPATGEIEQALDAIDYDRMLRRALLDEVAVGHAGFLAQAPGRVERIAAAVAGWSFEGDLAYYLATMRSAFEQLDLPREQRDWSVFEQDPPRRARLSAMALPVIGRLVRSIALKEAHLLLAREAIKLRQHRAEQGSYPDDWPMPADPATGGALHYERDDDGFRIWSDAEVGPRRRPIEWRWR